MKSPLSQIVLRWDGERLVPAAPIDRQALWKVPVGTLLTVSEYKPGTDRQRRSFWRLCGYGEDNQTEGTGKRWTKESISEGAKIEYGWIKALEVQLADDKIGFEVMSMNEMDKDEISRLLDDVMHFICERVIKGMRLEDLKLQIDRDARDEEAWGRRRSRS